MKVPHSLRQLEWDKSSGTTDPPFASANQAIERHNREIVSAYLAGLEEAARECDIYKQVNNLSNEYEAGRYYAQAELAGLIRDKISALQTSSGGV